MEKEYRIRVVHVDDKEDMVERVRKLLEAEPSVEYVAGFTNAEEALDFLRTEKVDLLLLDVEMPDKNGLWLAERLQHNSTEVIFVTYHAGYAAKAFEVCALDYVMKPIDKDKLHVALERFRHKREAEQPDIHQQIAAIYQYLDPGKRPTRIFVKGIRRTDIINLDEVVHFNSSSSYTNIITVQGKQLISSKPIRTYEEALRHHPDFIRISRAGIVNKKHIKAVQRQEAPRRISIITTNNETIETSFRSREDLLDLIAGV